MGKPPKKQTAARTDSRVKNPTTDQEPEMRSTDSGPVPDSSGSLLEQVESSLQELRSRSEQLSKVAQLTNESHREFGKLIDWFEAEIQRIENERAQLVIRETKVLQAESVAQANFAEERIASERDNSHRRER
jgi:hypothetical protein